MGKKMCHLSTQFTKWGVCWRKGCFKTIDGKKESRFLSLEFPRNPSLFDVCTPSKSLRRTPEVWRFCGKWNWKFRKHHVCLLTILKWPPFQSIVLQSGTPRSIPSYRPFAQTIHGYVFWNLRCCNNSNKTSDHCWSVCHCSIGLPFLKGNVPWS